MLGEFDVPASVVNGVLMVVLVAGVYKDVRYRRIPNWQTMPAVGLGLVLNGLFGGYTGLLSSLGGGVLGLAVLAVPYMLGYVGGGDVKLFMAVGALKGWFFTLGAGFYAMFAAGILALAVVVFRGSIFALLRYLLCIVANRVLWFYLPAGWQAKVASWKEEKPGVLSASLPAGLAIALGAVAQLYVQYAR